MSAVKFIPVAEEHRPLLSRWLSMPHVQEWWEDWENALDEIYDDTGYHWPFIAVTGDEPVAYIQAWRPTMLANYPWQHSLPQTARGMDIIIGETANLNRGLGTQIIKAFSAKLFAEGATRLLIDPEKENGRAVACYMKAGFTPYEEFIEDDRSITLLMELLPEDFVWLGDV